MKTLGSILTTVTSLQFPVIGKNGYGGEQDGSRVEFIGVLQVASRKEAEKIELGDAIGIHWATYSQKDGWKVSLAHWNDEDEADCFVHRNGVGRWL